MPIKKPLDGNLSRRDVLTGGAFVGSLAVLLWAVRSLARRRPSGDAEASSVALYRRFIDTRGFEVRALERGTKRTTPPPPFDVLRVVPGLANRAKTTIRLHPRRLAHDETLPRNVSKIGGDLAWPASEPWPICPEHKIPHVGALQLLKSDFPEFPFKPGTDVLQILWCPQIRHGAPQPVLYWRDSQKLGPLLETIPRPRFQSRAEEAEDEAYIYRTMGGRRLIPDTRKFEYADTKGVPLACRLFPERVREFPREKISGELLASEHQVFEQLPPPKKNEQLDKWPHSSFADFYWDELSVARGTKLLGYPAFVQGPEYPRCARGHRMDYLLSFDSEEPMDGRWQAIEDREIARMLEEKSRIDPYHQAWWALQQPSSVTIGDNGRLHVFVCRQCPEWPSGADHQW